MTTQTILSDSQVLRRVDLDLILEELLIFSRNNLIDRRSRATSTTESFSGDGSTTEFELTEDLDSQSRHKVMNVRTVKIDTASKTYFTDYVVGYSKEVDYTGKVKFWNPPANSTSISVKYDHTYQFVFAESPRVDLTSRAYPRISIQIKGNPKLAACGGKATRYEIEVTYTIIDLKRDYVESLINQIDRLFTEKSNQTGFHNFQWIYIDSISDIVPASEDENDTLYGAQVKLLIPHEYQFSK